MSATRPALLASATGKPVSGETAALGAAVVEGARLVVVMAPTLARSLAAFPPPPQAASTSSAAMTTMAGRRMRCVSELPERFDSLGEGWCGEAVDAGTGR